MTIIDYFLFPLMVKHVGNYPNITVVTTANGWCHNHVSPDSALIFMPVKQWLKVAFIIVYDKCYSALITGKMHYTPIYWLLNIFFFTLEFITLICFTFYFNLLQSDRKTQQEPRLVYSWSLLNCKWHRVKWHHVMLRKDDVKVHRSQQFSMTNDLSGPGESCSQTHFVFKTCRCTFIQLSWSYAVSTLKWKTQCDKSNFRSTQQLLLYSAVWMA